MELAGSRMIEVNQKERTDTKQSLMFGLLRNIVIE